MLGFLRSPESKLRKKYGDKFQEATQDMSKAEQLKTGLLLEHQTKKTERKAGGRAWLGTAASIGLLAGGAAGLLPGLAAAGVVLGAGVAARKIGSMRADRAFNKGMRRADAAT